MLVCEKSSQRILMMWRDEDRRPKDAENPNVVAPATRSTSPNKVTLTKTQVALAKRLGVPLEEYAKQAALQKRNG